MLRSLPQASIRTLHANSHEKKAVHAQLFWRCVIGSYIKDVCAHYCASLVRTLFIRHALLRHVFQTRAPSKTQQNIELMTSALI